MESVRWLIDLARQAGVERIILNGSFVTDIMEPNDVDCVLLLGTQRHQSQTAFSELRKGLPFLDISIVRSRAFEEFVRSVFAVDRAGSPKGMIEVVQWS